MMDQLLPAVPAMVAGFAIWAARDAAKRYFATLTIERRWFDELEALRADVALLRTEFTHADESMANKAERIETMCVNLANKTKEELEELQTSLTKIAEQKRRPPVGGVARARMQR